MLILANLAPAAAESGDLPPVPLANVVDQFGMNLSTGVWQQPGPSISIGPKEQGGLSYTWMWGGNVRNPYTGTVKETAGLDIVVSVLGKSESFKPDGSGGWEPRFATGGTLAVMSGNYTYTDKYGTVSYFPALALTPCTDYCTVGLIGTTTFPNGMVYTYTWRYLGSLFELSSLTTNLGYQLKFNFASNSSGDPANYLKITKVMAINNAVEYCDPSPSVGCTPSNPWPSITISRSGTLTSGVVTATDSLGENWTDAYEVTNLGDTSAVEDTVSDPTGRSVIHFYSVTGTISPVISGRTATVGGNSWTYDIAPAGAAMLGEVVDPNKVKRHVTTWLESGQPLIDQLDPDGIDYRTTYRYDPSADPGGLLDLVIPPDSNIVGLEYDGRGNVTQRVETGTGKPLTTDYAYPGSCTYQKSCNKPASSTDAMGNTTDYTYDTTHGGVLTVQGPAVNGVRSLTTTTYAGFTAWYYTGPSTISQGSTVYLPTGTTTCTNANSCSGNAAERVTALTYQSGNSSTGSNLLNLTSTVKAGDNSISATTTNAYDAVGNVTSLTNARGNTTVFFYDSGRRQYGVVQPTPGNSIYPATRTTYDDAGRVLKVEQGTTPGQTLSHFSSFSSLSQAENTYDSVTGALIKEVASLGTSSPVVQSVTQYSYDAGGRLLCTARRQNTSSLPVDACEQSSGDKDLISKNGYDAANRLLTVKTGVDTAHEVTSLTNHYSTTLGPGVIDWIEDGKGNRSTFSYDGLMRLAGITFPSKTTPNTSDTNDYESYTYDLQGNMTLKRLRSGDAVGMSYDARNRLAVKDMPGVVVNDDIYYSYNQVDDLVSALYGSSGGSGVSYTWDALGRKLTESSYGRTMTSAYDAAGNRTRLTYPDSAYVDYSYDVLDRMQGMFMSTGTAGTPTNWGAANWGAFQWSGPTSVSAQYAYDELGRIVSITRSNSANTSASYSVSSQSWNLSQNLASTGQDVTFAMTYTPSGQVLTRDINNSAYQYSSGSSANTYCSNGLNQYDKVQNSSSACSGGQTYTYDERGNLLSDGVRAFTYDRENKLTRIVGPGSSGIATNWNAANWNAFQWSGPTTSYLGYDPQGRMRQIEGPAGTQQYLYDGDALLVEYDGVGTVLRRYVPGQGVDETLIWFEGANLLAPNWLHTDQQGSVVAASNTSGVSATTYAYGPYGEPSGGFASGGPAFRYTGQVQLPAHNLYYYKARMYDPALGRFLQTDPIGYDAGMNLYAYAANNPMNAADPTGLAENCSAALVYSDGRRDPFLCGTPSLPGCWGMDCNAIDAYWDQVKSQLSDVCASIGAPDGSCGFQKMIGDVTSLANYFSRDWLGAADYLVAGLPAGKKASSALRGAKEFHHLLPQAKKFAGYFKRVGLNIEDYKIPLGRAEHRLKPHGLHTKGGGDWNGVWSKFFNEYPNATKQQILNQLDRMRQRFGI